MDILSEKVTKYYKNQKPPNNQTLFTDDQFPPNESSLISLDGKGNFSDLIDGKEKASFIKIDKIKWKRASEIFDSDYSLFNTTNQISMSDIQQGNLGNCYFLSPIAALTSYPNLIYQIFKTKTVNIYGYYEIILYIDGEFQIVLIDDFFPVEKKNEKKLQFAKANNNAIWVILLEKAWAKVNGGYSNIIGGSPGDALRALTGFSKLTIKNKDFDESELYDKIIECLDYQCICCATTIDEEKNGLLANHAFSVLKCFEVKIKKKNYHLVKLRNPWGYIELTGDLKDKCKFLYEELRQSLKKDKSFTFFVDPQTCRIVLGMRASKFGTYWYSLCSKFTNVEKKKENSIPKNDFILTDDKKDLFIIKNIKDYNMIYDYISLPLNMASKSSIILNSFLEEMKKEFPEIIRKYAKKRYKITRKEKRYNNIYRK